MQPQDLRLPAWALIILGLFCAISAWPPASGGLNMMLDLIYWPMGDGPVLEGTASGFVVGVAGGIMIGWGVTLAVIAEGGSLRQALLFGALGWFVPDSIASVVSGAPLNVAFNLVFLLLLLSPLRGASRIASQS